MDDAAAQQPIVKRPMNVYQLVIQWSPDTGQVQVQFPNVDDVSRLGMLEVAKGILLEARVKAGVAASEQLVIPARGLPH